MEADYDYCVKCVVAGAAGVGKSALIGGNGPSCLNVTMRMYSKRDRSHLVQLWDMKGSDRHIAWSSYSAVGAACAVFVFNVCDEDTLTSVEEWYSHVVKTAAASCVKILVGNTFWCHPTKGLKHRTRARVVSEGRARAFAANLGMTYLEASTTEDFDHAIRVALAKVSSNLPYPVEPVALLRRGVKIGQRLAEDPEYRRDLFAMAPK
eukprot:Rmarinus@m.13227